jgi:WD40 repeat protein
LPIEDLELPHTLLRPNISFSPGGKDILFSDVNNVTHVFKTEDYSFIRQREGSSRVYDDVRELSPDGLYSANISFDYGYNSVVVSDMVTGNEIIKIGGYNTAFAFSPDSKMIAVSLFTTYSNVVSIYGLPEGNELFSTGSYFCEGDYAPKVAFSPDGKYVAILPLYGYPQIWGIP